MKRTINYMSAILLAAVSCTSLKEDQILNFPVSEIKDPGRTEVLRAEQVNGEDVDLFSFIIHGGMMVSQQRRSNDNMLFVNKVNSGDELGQFCRRGRGPGEFLSLSPYFGVHDKDKIGLFDIASRTYVDLNLTSSLEQGKTILDSPVALANEDGSHNALLSAYTIPGEKIISFNSRQGAGAAGLSQSPSYTIFDRNTGSVITDYDLFRKEAIEKKAGGPGAISAFSLVDCIKEDGSQLCFAMNHMPVIGIVNTATGESFGVRISKSDEYDPENKNFEFMSVCSDKDRIYALYYGMPGEQVQSNGKSYIYELNWKGKVLHKYEVEGVYTAIRADHGTLYLAGSGDNHMNRLFSVKLKASK